MGISGISSTYASFISNISGREKDTSLFSVTSKILNTTLKPSSNNPSLLKQIIGEEKAHTANHTLSLRMLSDGIIHKTIKKQNNVFAYPTTGSREEHIHATMKTGSQYDSVRITNGANNLDVLHTPDSVFGKTSNDLLNDNNVNGPKAFINGGFSAFLPEMLIVSPATAPGKDPNKDSSAIPTGDKYRGFKIGHANGCENKLPIPGEWRDDYGHLVKDNEKLLSCGPYLNDEKMDFKEQRFNYYYPNGQKNLSAYFQGNLAHCGNPNPRAAISINEGKDVTLHTLTTKNYQRDLGVTMADWKKIVEMGAPNSQSLNLDGAGSISMGYVNSAGRIEQISKGDEKLRPVANILTVGAMPYGGGNEPTVSINKE